MFAFQSLQTNATITDSIVPTIPIVVRMTETRTTLHGYALHRMHIPAINARSEILNIDNNGTYNNIITYAHQYIGKNVYLLACTMILILKVVIMLILLDSAVYSIEHPLQYQKYGLQLHCALINTMQTTNAKTWPISK